MGPLSGPSIVQAFHHSPIVDLCWISSLLRLLGTMVPRYESGPKLLVLEEAIFFVHAEDFVEQNSLEGRIS